MKFILLLSVVLFLSCNGKLEKENEVLKSEIKNLQDKIVELSTALDSYISKEIEKRALTEKRGPTIKGLYLGMTEEEVLNFVNDKKYRDIFYPEELRNNIEKFKGKKGWDERGAYFFENGNFTLMKYNKYDKSWENDYIYIPMNVSFDRNGKANKIYIKSDLVSKLFNSGSLSEAEFMQKFVNSYCIPTLEQSKEYFFGIFDGIAYGYTDRKNGWEIMISKSTEIKLYKITADSEMTFGD
ncbi:MAG: hypothetical protein JXR48_10125 [Candidatus Delongbacteria bacterium]|nr:hypothetical protein [Candidatus Delongbacteria bacterium]MBN2835311.1 hypothetical protein [Candidatus Delongbacteria bacterium]